MLEVALIFELSSTIYFLEIISEKIDRENRINLCAFTISIFCLIRFCSFFYVYIRLHAIMIFVMLIYLHKYVVFIFSLIDLANTATYTFRFFDILYFFYRFKSRVQLYSLKNNSVVVKLNTPVYSANKLCNIVELSLHEFAELPSYILRGNFTLLIDYFVRLPCRQIRKYVSMS